VQLVERPPVSQIQMVNTSWIRDVDGAILLFDLTDPQINHLTPWIEEITRLVSTSVPRIIVGNKYDLLPQNSMNSPKFQVSFFKLGNFI
jgi:GTPase SAR1 family protein